MTGVALGYVDINAVDTDNVSSIGNSFPKTVYRRQTDSELDCLVRNKITSQT